MHEIIVRTDLLPGWDAWIVTCEMMAATYMVDRVYYAVNSHEAFFGKPVPEHVRDDPDNQALARTTLRAWMLDFDNIMLSGWYYDDTMETVTFY